MSIKVLTKCIHHVIVNMGVFVGKQHTRLDIGIIRLMVNIVLQTAQYGIGRLLSRTESTLTHAAKQTHIKHSPERTNTHTHTHTFAPKQQHTT